MESVFHSVLQHPQTFAACDDLVGRAPRPAADPVVGLLKHAKNRTRGSGADEGVRPTFGRGSVSACKRVAASPSRARQRDNESFIPQGVS